MQRCSWAQVCVQHWGWGDEQIICVLALRCLTLPCAGGRCGKGSPPPATGYYHRENLDILHEKLFIFVHICIIFNGDNKRYSHFNARKHEIIRQNIGRRLLRCTRNQITGGAYSPRIPSVSAPMEVPRHGYHAVVKVVL